MAIGSVVLTRLSVSTIDMNVVLWSTEIGGTRTEVTNFTVAAILTIAAALAGRAKFNSSTTEFGTTGKVLLPLWFAIVTGFAVRSTGTIFTVACLLLPPLFARAMASTFLARIATAALLALVATTAGWIIAPHYLCSFALPAACIMALMAGAAGVRGLAGRKDTAVSEAPSL
jgi:ABC-type Mn2+/Zn2+ transport system permease subunit